MTNDITDFVAYAKTLRNWAAANGYATVGNMTLKEIAAAIRVYTEWETAQREARQRKNKDKLN